MNIDWPRISRALKGIPEPPTIVEKIVYVDKPYDFGDWTGVKYPIEDKDGKLWQAMIMKEDL